MTVSSEEGGATVLAAAALAALLVIVVAIVHVGSAVGARHQAQSAADLSALAAAGELNRGVGDACATAREIVSRSKGEVTECVVEGWDVVVTVTITVPLGRFGIADAVASARAGPA